MTAKVPQNTLFRRCRFQLRNDTRVLWCDPSLVYGKAVFTHGAMGDADGVP
jgi:hypothetical protein